MINNHQVAACVYPRAKQLPREETETLEHSLFMTEIMFMLLSVVPDLIRAASTQRSSFSTCARAARRTAAAPHQRSARQRCRREATDERRAEREDGDARAQLGRLALRVRLPCLRRGRALLPLAQLRLRRRQTSASSCPSRCRTRRLRRSRPSCSICLIPMCTFMTVT